MTNKRPFGVTILAILAGIAAFIAILHTLQMLHLFPISGPFGIFRFFTFDLFGAILWGILALIYLWVMNKLWNLDPQGWLFVAALSALNLILAVLSIIGQSSLRCHAAVNRCQRSDPDLCPFTRHQGSLWRSHQYKRGCSPGYG